MKVGLLFRPSAQAVGMGAELAKRSSLAAQLFERAAAQSGHDLFKSRVRRFSEQLNRTEFVQPALFVHSFAALKQLECERSDLWENVLGVDLN